MLKLWGRPNSSNTQKALWACEEAGVPFELIKASGTMGVDGHVLQGGSPYGVVDTPAYRAMNPNGRIPTIDDDGFVLWESNVIVRYLAATYAPEKLYGADGKTFALASQWMDWEQTRLLPPLHSMVMEYVRLPPEQRRPAEVDEAREVLLGHLAILEGHLATRAYVAGEAFSMGDIPPSTQIWRWFVLEPERPSLPQIEAWMARLREREGFCRHIEPAHLHRA